MANNVQVCDIPEETLEAIKSFRFRKDTSNAALILKVDQKRQAVYVDENLDHLEGIEELKENLPEHQPRFVVYSCRVTHSDGHVSVPMLFFFITPQDCHPHLQMMYVGTKSPLVDKAKFTKTYEFRDLEDLTEEWLKSKICK
nr:glia maturation factor beta [Parasacculina yatsui]